RIRSLADAMGYKPDPALQALMAYRSRISPRRATTTLAYVTNWSSRWGWKHSPAHAEFFEGAHRKAEELGFTLEHFWLGEPGQTHQRLNDILVARGIRGVVIASHLESFDDSVHFDWKQFSAVKIDFFPRSLELNHITNDQCAIAQLAVRRTLAAGYRRIGFVMPRWWDDFVDLAWSAGFLSSQHRLPTADHVPLLVYDNDRIAQRAKAPQALVPQPIFSDWLRRHEPEVIISYSPFVVPRFSELGLRVPEDIAFVDLFLENTNGCSAGVRQNCLRVGEVALETLAGLLAQNTTGLPITPSATLVEGTWLDGDSLPTRTLPNTPEARGLTRGIDNPSPYQRVPTPAALIL
ncbi:MAG TPA: LacI family transcriptional regulator, partial [Opitutus sp.]|nr:LacI family transcriptional regulator [Opitutus sp.]